ncbi:MAG TPA: dephospho-CoA kinase [Flexivirga sp.]|uniref:dephospho-CoA kinase n=1 Tax=Flexivirga sp. TaxID=1962927 RepID=UPI002C19DF13|nr:dephospho-CoA kinase [Flexivirga sp.]HWC21927.1 dephospho-CoA kinase [Flexivirga sp.]
MLYLGLSGGIGSGKSTVSARLAELGAVVIDADALARAVVDRGSDGLAEVAARFGDGVLLPDGSLNRPALGAIVFADEAARRDLEAITHPRIRELTAQQHAQAPLDAIVVHDMPLLVEGGLAADYHLTLIVDAAEDVRIERIMRDRGMSHADAQARVSAQATDEQRYAAADVVLDNNGTREQLLDQVETLWRERLSPYNENLLADRPALDDPTGAEGDRMDVSIRRASERLRRQFAIAGLSEHVRVRARPASSAGEPVGLVLSTDHDPARSAVRPALRAAGFVPLPKSTGTNRLAFASCDPEAPVLLQLRHVTK